MVYDIYFHNDFDGVASAAVVFDYLKKRGDRAGKLCPVDYTVIPDWFRKDFFLKNRLCGGSKNPAIVMDFPFHPQAKFWFDHHEDPFEKPEWKEAFKPSPNHIWDSSRYSCCGLILDSLSENFGYKPPRHLKELAGWLDILDGARYKSVRQALSTKGAFLLNACVGQARKEERLFPLFVKTLSEKPISGVLKMPVVAKIARKIKTETSESMDFYRKNTKIFGNSTYVDETGLRSRPLRYAPNRLFPKMKFSVRRHADANLKGIFHFSVGFNPWMDERKLKISIRDLLAKYGGGGHRKVGGLEIRGKIKADKVEREIIDFLNKN